ncbi:M20/M25/M40 family metallo-hydrolase [Candidatus Collierbacteria bacterium]|nr:M20/M25/M40 family metallo-hydrolase [Candidatus Collierbacteria bacterium]
MNNTIDLLKQLIAIPSFVDKENDERVVVDFIKSKLSKNKRLKVTEQVVIGKRRNLIALDGGNPQIILFGHTDTVQPKVQERSPFEPFEKDGKLFGLGSVDMKSGLAMMLDIALNSSRPGLGYIFTVDEEYSFKGARKLVEDFKLKPKLIINVESTNLKILNGCRGVSAIEAVVIGKAAHSGRKYLGINAIEKAVELIDRFEKFCQTFDPNGVQTSTNLCFLNGGLGSGDGEVKSVDNIVPNYAKIHFSIRIGNPKVTLDFIKENLVKIGKDLGVEVSEINVKFIFGPFLTPKSRLKQFEKAMTENQLVPNYADINSQGFYEVQIIQTALGCDCIAFGPGPNEMSHCKDEYVDLTQLAKAQDVIKSYLDTALPPWRT